MLFSWVRIRADEIDAKKVAAIEYTAYEEMALDRIHEIRENAFEKFDLSCMHIYHRPGNGKGWRDMFFCVCFISTP